MAFQVGGKLENTLEKLMRLLNGKPKARSKAKRRSNPMMYRPVIVNGDVHYTDVKKQEPGTIFYILIILGIGFLGLMLGSYIMGKQNC